VFQVHELAHQWFGNSVSVRGWRDIWLNEGFASYAEALWFEHRGGLEDYRLYMTNIQGVVDPSGPIYDPPGLFDGNTVYNKGAWVVHMLRGVLGDSLFYAALAEYRDRMAYRSATSEEFQAIVEDVAERDLDWFFEPWLHGRNRPEYAVSFLPFTENGEEKVAIHLGQTQRDAPYFPMPLDLEIDLDGGVFRTRVWNDPDHEDWEFTLVRRAEHVTVDPDSWVLKHASATPYGLHITSTELPRGTEDSLVVLRPRARGGVPPYRWSVLDSLPPGLTLEAVTGEIHGVAPAVGIYAFTLELADAQELRDSQLYRWEVTAEPDTIGTPPDTTGGVLTEAFAAYPVPARERMTLEIGEGGEVGGPVLLEIFDLGGRRVRTLWDGPGAPRRIDWDGRDDRGERVPSGIYLGRMRLGGRSVSRRLVWLWSR
jgi:hypothetical protein